MERCVTPAAGAAGVPGGVPAGKVLFPLLRGYGPGLRPWSGHGLDVIVPQAAQVRLRWPCFVVIMGRVQRMGWRYDRMNDR